MAQFSQLVRPANTSVPRGGLLQRKCACGGKAGGECESCRQQNAAQRKPAGMRADAPAAIQTSPQLTRGGSRMPPSLERQLASRYGSDFAGVRIHHDASSHAATRSINARAFTLGQHIHFGAGEYRPQEREGMRLLAHELAHTVQQRGADPTHGASVTVDQPDSPLEREADRAADRLLADAAPPLVHQRAAGPRALLRQVNPAAPAPAPAPAAAPKPQREERFNLGRGGNRMDAELDRSVGWLTAKVKCKFNAINSPLPWPSPARFAQFQADYIRAVTDRWNFKHYLVPATTCAGEPQLVSVRVQIIPVTSGQHFTINVGYSSTHGQSAVNQKTRIVTLDAPGVTERDDIPQRPVEHEFGHMLGLPHIHCDSNDDECYGTTSEEKADEMGQGSFVSPRDYEPFAELMKDFTGCVYKVKQASFIPPSSLPGIFGAVGSLLGGAALGLMGMAIGSAFGPVGALVGGVIGAVGGLIGGFFGGREIGRRQAES
jgi:uncharacterized protein DUF4157